MADIVATPSSQPTAGIASKDCDHAPPGAGAGTPKKEAPLWTRGPVVAGLLGSLFGLAGAVAGMGAVWGTSQATVTATADKVRKLEDDVATKADKASIERDVEIVRQQGLDVVEIRTMNTAEHLAMNIQLEGVKKETAETRKKVEVMERNLDVKLDKVLAKLK